MRSPEPGRLWFAAEDDEDGRELWSTDGTSAGTRMLDLVPGTELWMLPDIR